MSSTATAPVYQEKSTVTVVNATQRMGKLLANQGLLTICLYHGYQLSFYLPLPPSRQGMLSKCYLFL